jgi:hypothetical protein
MMILVNPYRVCQLSVFVTMNLYESVHKIGSQG